MTMKLFSRNVGIILITCFVLCFFSLSSTVFAQAQPNSPENASAQENSSESGETPNIASELGFTGAAMLVYNALTAIGSWVTYLGGFLLDISLSWFVWGMAETTDHFKLNEVINTVWALVRDLFNLLFIFGFIYIGFQLILGLDDSGSKRTLGTLIIAALLINFSLYAAQVVVDFGNIASIEIASQFSSTSNSEVMGRPVFNIADSFVRATELDNLSSSTLSSIGELSGGIREVPSSGIDFSQALVIGLTVALMLIVLGFVFAAGAVLMMVRYFYLIFLMMFSPLMVLGFVLPQFKSKSSEWWSTLFKQVLIGPAYLFMLYVSLLALQAFADVPSNQGITTFIMMSVIVSGFAWASLIIAQKIGALGASQAMNFGQGIGKKVRGGVTGFAGRNTIGRMADSYARRLEERGVSDKSWRRSVASSLAGNKFGGSYSRADARSSAEKASQNQARYDQLHGTPTTVRGVQVPGTRTGGVVGAINSGTDIEMEQAITGMSNDQLIKMLQDNDKNSSEYEKIVENMSASQYDAVMKAKAEDLDDSAKADIKGGRKVAVETTLGSLSANIKNASNHQLKVLGADEIAKHAGALKQSQFEEIMKPSNSDYTESEKKAIADKRKVQQKTEFDADAASFFAKRKDKEIAKLPDTILTNDNAAPHLTRASLKQMIHEDSLAKADRDTIKSNIGRLGTTDTKDWLRSTEGRLF